MPMKLWILADKLIIPALQNQAMDIITSSFIPRIHEFTPVFSDYLYSNTDPESQLRRMVIDFVARFMPPGHFRKHKDDWNSELLRDVCCLFMDQVRGASNIHFLFWSYYVANTAGWKPVDVQ
jgi:hypothetical protein